MTEVTSNWIESYRVTIDVPEAALEGFIQKVSPHIPSFLGNYDHVCIWFDKATEQHRHVNDGNIMRATCARFELSIQADDEVLNSIINDHVIPNHPWEEPVILVTKQKIFVPSEKD